jgi:hypothetical protein
MSVAKYVYQFHQSQGLGVAYTYSHYTWGEACTINYSESKVPRRFKLIMILSHCVIPVAS